MYGFVLSIAGFLLDAPYLAHWLAYDNPSLLRYGIEVQSKRLLYSRKFVSE